MWVSSILKDIPSAGDESPEATTRSTADRVALPLTKEYERGRHTPNFSSTLE